MSVNKFICTSMYEKAVLIKSLSLKASNIGSIGAPNSFSVSATLSRFSTSCFTSGSRMSDIISWKCVRMFNVEGHSHRACTSFSWWTQLQWWHSLFSRITGRVHNRVMKDIVRLSDVRLHTWYTIDGVIPKISPKWSMRKNEKSRSIASRWFHKAVSLWLRARFTSVFHSRLVGTWRLDESKLLIMACKLHFNKIWEMSHTNPKVTEVLLFMKSLNFLMKSFLDTDPTDRDIILWRNISFWESIFEGSRFSPTIDSAMSDCVDSPSNCLTALCWALT